LEAGEKFILNLAFLGVFWGKNADFNSHLAKPDAQELLISP
jgi:hypothetical protein